MKIKSITFRPGIIRRPRVAVTLENGNTYTLKHSAGLVICKPVPTEAEKAPLQAVYRAAWLFMERKAGEPLDRGAKIACGKIVELYDWPQDFTQDTQTRLEYIVNKIQFAENL